MRESRRPPFFKFIEYPREEFSLRGYFFLPMGLIGLIRPVGQISLMGLICAINRKQDWPNKPDRPNRLDGLM